MKENSTWQNISQNREIKFKIRDKVAKDFFMWEDIQVHTHYVFMQYTWLKDKNWKEIYEWDKVKFYNWYYDDITEVVRYKSWWRWLEWCESFLHELFVRKDENKKELWNYLDVELVF